MDEETLTVWLDTALLMLGGFVLMMTVMNPPTKSSESDNVQAPGNVIIEAQWADKLDADVDLWVQAPGDVPVGYSNKSGHIFNLLRDDLGKAHDITDYNYEVAYTRGTPGGEYVINLHMYRGRSLSYPVAVKIVASVKGDPTGSAKQLVATTVELRKEGQEMTALRFRLDARRPRARHCQQPVQTAAHGRQMIISAIVFALLLGAFIFLILPSARSARRTLSVGIFVLLIGVIYGGSVELLGRPKPLRLEWRGTADAQVLGAMPVENEAIYVWLVMPGATEPCAYVLPWSLEAAQQLQDAMNQAEADGTGVRMGIPFEASLDDREPMFYAMPQPAMPAKDYPGSTPLIHLQPDEAS